MRVEARQQHLAPGAVLLRGFAGAASAALAADLQHVIAQAPFRQMVTPGGLSMSVAMTNCGACGWVSDRTGYRYDPIDPDSGKPWPPMPESFLRLAARSGTRRRLRRVRARRLSDQPLPDGRQAVAAPGQGRARLRSADRVGVARRSRDLSVRRLEAIREDDARAGAAWRRPRLGRAGAAQLPRRIADQGRASSVRRRASHQSYVAPGGLRFPRGGRHAVRRAPGLESRRLPEINLQRFFLDFLRDPPFQAKAPLRAPLAQASGAYNRGNSFR